MREHKMPPSVQNLLAEEKYAFQISASTNAKQTRNKREALASGLLIALGLGVALQGGVIALIILGKYWGTGARHFCAGFHIRTRRPRSHMAWRPSIIHIRDHGGQTHFLMGT